MTDQLVHLDPATLVLGSNLRTDTHPDAREFARLTKTRGVLKVITAYRTEPGEVAVLRGQRRTLVAAQAGTPTGSLISSGRTCAAPRPTATGRSARTAHQLALLGISITQTAKRTPLHELESTKPSTRRSRRSRSTFHPSDSS